MSEIQNFADATWFKYVITAGIGLVSCINALIYYIFSALKKDVDKMRTKVDLDHDRLNRIETAHDIYHPKNGN